MSSSLPEGWIVAKLEDLAEDISYGFTASSTAEALGPRMLRITDIQEGQVTWNKVPYCEIDKGKKKKYLLKEGDLVFARTGATVGKSFLVKGDVPEAVFASYLIRVRCLQSDTPNFLVHYFQSSGYWNQITEFSAGIGQPNVNGSKLKTLNVPLPPLAEQKRITQKLDELLAQVETLKARIDAMPALLARLRQSTLSAAVSGLLSQDWRASNPGARFDVEQIPNTAKTRRGVPDDVAMPNTIKSLTAPSGWSWASAAELLKKGIFLDLKDGNHGANHPKSSELAGEGIPFITAANVTASGKIDYEGAPKISGEPLKKLRVGFSKPGDVILTHKGTVGRVAVNVMHCVLTPQTTYYRLNGEYLSNAYLWIFLRSNRFTIQTDDVKSQTTRDFVPITAQYELFHLIPPRTEQLEIVRRVDQIFAFADQLESNVAIAKQRVDSLTQSILAKAFRGELVPQDPNDEPASVLLERIRAQRASAPKPGRGRAKT